LLRGKCEQEWEGHIKPRMEGTLAEVCSVQW